MFLVIFGCYGVLNTDGYLLRNTFSKLINFHLLHSLCLVLYYRLPSDYQICTIYFSADFRSASCFFKFCHDLND